MSDKQQQQPAAQAHPAHKEKTGTAFGIKVHEWLIAVGLGAISGTFTSTRKINDLFKEDAEKATAFKGHFGGYTEKQWHGFVDRKFEVLRLNHNKATGENIDRETWLAQHEGEITELKANIKKGIKERLDDIDFRKYLQEGKTPKEYRAAIRDEKKLIADDFAEVAELYRGVRRVPTVEKIGHLAHLVHPNRFFSTLDKFETFSERSMGEIAFNGAVGAAIGAAMTVSFFNGLATRDRIDKIATQTGADSDVTTR